MFRYIYIYPRYLTKEEMELRALRWKLLLWLFFTLYIGGSIYGFFEVNKVVALPQFVKFLVYLFVPTTLSWLLVLSLPYVFRALLVFLTGWFLIVGVRQLWQLSAN